jgi:hypothetical protein
LLTCFLDASHPYHSRVFLYSSSFWFAKVLLSIYSLRSEIFISTYDSLTSIYMLACCGVARCACVLPSLILLYPCTRAYRWLFGPPNPAQHEHDAARWPSCSCHAGTTCRGQGVARARGPFFVPCRHDGTTTARWAIYVVPAHSTMRVAGVVVDPGGEGAEEVVGTVDPTGEGAE